MIRNDDVPEFDLADIQDILDIKPSPAVQQAQRAAIPATIIVDPDEADAPVDPEVRFLPSLPLQI